MTHQVIASPQPGPQTHFITCPVFEICYGGARGGGKTIAVLLKWAVHADLYGSKASGIIFRRERTHLVRMIQAAQQMYTPVGAVWKEQAKEFHMPGGGILRFAYIESDKDAEAYQGHDYNFLGIEELTQFPDPAPIKKLKATLRSGEGVPCYFVATCNPGGPGHNWVKARYIDPAPEGYKILDEDGLQRVFIPARLSDNKLLTDNDPEYVARLRQSGSPQLVKAWLEGDWNVIEGSYFPEFGAHHIIAPFEIPAHWTRYRAFDWGSFRPYACLWFAVSDGTAGSTRPGDLIVYRELYGSTGEPNVGLKQDADTVAQAIVLSDDPAEKITFSVADPAIFKNDGGPSIAERMAHYKVFFAHADNARVAGWTELRRRLTGYDGKPSIYLFTTCRHLIRTLPSLQHDEHKPEDVDTEGEDHLGDTLRYGCMARPMTTHKVEEIRPLNGGILVKDLFKPRKINNERI